MPRRCMRHEVVHVKPVGGGCATCGNTPNGTCIPGRSTAEPGGGAFLAARAKTSRRHQAVSMGTALVTNVLL